MQHLVDEVLDHALGLGIEREHFLVGASTGCPDGNGEPATRQRLSLIIWQIIQGYRFFERIEFRR